MELGLALSASAAESFDPPFPPRWMEALAIAYGHLISSNSATERPDASYALGDLCSSKATKMWRQIVS